MKIQRNDSNRSSSDEMIPLLTEEQIEEMKRKVKERAGSQDRLAKITDIPLGTLQRILSGFQQPRLEYAIRISLALGEPVETFFRINNSILPKSLREYIEERDRAKINTKKGKTNAKPN